MGVLLPGEYDGGKIKVEDHPAGSLLTVNGKTFIVNGAGALVHYEKPKTKTETVIGGTKVPKPPKI